MRNCSRDARETQEQTVGSAPARNCRRDARSPHNDCPPQSMNFSGWSAGRPMHLDSAMPSDKAPSPYTARTSPCAATGRDANARTNRACYHFGAGKQRWWTRAAGPTCVCTYLVAARVARPGPRGRQTRRLRLKICSPQRLCCCVRIWRVCGAKSRHPGAAAACIQACLARSTLRRVLSM